MEPPLLSVCVITYNHVNYIRQAIEGVLMQKTSFNFNLIIADDFSTDGTREIILEYKRKNPEKIDLILQSSNVGGAQNWINLLDSPKSKYIAYLEGDDYWIDEQKLEKQVQILEAESDIVLVFHNTLDDVKGIKKMKYEHPLKSTFDFDDFASFLYARSLSIVFRNLKSKLPDPFKFLRLGDWPFALYLLQDGKARYLHETMGVYRFHEAGVWNQASPTVNTQRVFETFLHVKSILRPEFWPAIDARLYFYSLSYVKASLLSAKLRNAFTGLKWFLTPPSNLKIIKLKSSK